MGNRTYLAQCNPVFFHFPLRITASTCNMNLPSSGNLETKKKEHHPLEGKGQTVALKISFILPWWSQGWSAWAEGHVLHRMGLLWKLQDKNYFCHAYFGAVWAFSLQALKSALSRGTRGLSGVERAERCSDAARLALGFLQKYSFHIAPETNWFAAVTSHGVLAVSSHVPWNVLPLTVRYSFGNISRGWFIYLQNAIIQSHYYDHSYYSKAWRSQPGSELKTFTARGNANALRCCLGIGFTALLIVNGVSHLYASLETWILHLDLAHSGGSVLYQCHLQLLIIF